MKSGFAPFLLLVSGCGQPHASDQPAVQRASNSADPLDALVKERIAARQGAAPATKADIEQERIAATRANALSGLQEAALRQRVERLEEQQLELQRRVIDIEEHERR